MELEKYLPIGSIVKVKDEKNLFMITGYLIKQENKIYDYSVCLYPDGVLSLNELMVFNHESIEEVHYQGFKAKEYERFNELLDKIKKEVEKI